jgi:hypothetical protein
MAQTASNQYQYEFKIQYGGSVMLIFSVYSLRFIFYPFLWRGPGLDVFLPVMSPVYRQAEHWQEELESIAVVSHVSFGAIMLCLATLQLDKSFRRQYPHYHRWCGRFYVVSGVFCVISLLILRASAGAGSAPTGRSQALAVFIDISVTLWVLATVTGVIAAMCKKYDMHRDFMVFSVALACVPIAQRVFSWGLMTPAALLLRALVCLPANVYPWSTRWGPPGSTTSLLLGSCTDCAVASSSDPRACPLLYSLDGYGEGEQASFAASAWAGLAVVVSWGLPRVLKHVMGRCGSPLEGDVKYDADADLLSSLSYADTWRREKDRVAAIMGMPGRCVESLLNQCPADFSSSRGKRHGRSVLAWLGWAVFVVGGAVYLACGVALAVFMLSMTTYIFTVFTVGSVMLALYAAYTSYYRAPVNIT